MKYNQIIQEFKSIETKTKIGFSIGKKYLENTKELDKKLPDFNYSTFYLTYSFELPH